MRVLARYNEQHNTLMGKMLAVILGAFVGAVVVTLLGFALIMAIPSARADGQSAMIVFLTVPIGAVLGAVRAARK